MSERPDLNWSDRPSKLTVTAEEFGQWLASELDRLARGLRHDSALVREGTILGLYHIKGSLRDIEEVVLDMAEEDKSEGVRTVARDF